MHAIEPGAPRTVTAELALVRRFPALAALPRHALTTLPTPVAPLARLAAARGLGPLWIKRDDVSCALYGGNKPRKLEWLLGAARARGRRAVITFGGIGTHHGLATALCARDAGLGRRAVTRSELRGLDDQVAAAQRHLGDGRVGGAPTEAGVAALRLFAEREGVELETTYTAKTAAALLDLASRPAYRGLPLLFWNTYSAIDPADALPRLPD